jgi:hypothetical protein
LERGPWTGLQLFEIQEYDLIEERLVREIAHLKKRGVGQVASIRASGTPYKRGVGEREREREKGGGGGGYKPVHSEIWL